MTVRFAHISDTHIGPSRDFVLYGVQTYERLERLIDRLNEHAATLDFVVHTGDLVNAPAAESFALAAETLSRLKCPLYLVVGNHDTADGLRKIGNGPGMVPLDASDSAYSYSFSYGKEQFIVLDARGPDSIDPHGLLSERQASAFRKRLSETTGPVSVFVHFPAFPLDSPWFDAHMRILNEELFREIVESAADRVRGVFFGHVHRGIQVIRRGVFYCSVPSSFCQFQAWPNHEGVEFDPSPLAYYHLITLTDQQMLVRQMDVGI